MYCASCGNWNEDTAKFCDRCGADLRGMPRPAVAPAPAPAPVPPAAPPPAYAYGPPMVYRPSRSRAWWYPIGVWLILSAFFLFTDLVASGGRILWAYWPIGVLGIFMVGIPLLHRIEARSLARSGQPPR